MSTKKKSVFKAGIWYTISNFLVKGITFLTMPLFTRIMSSDDIGLFSNISSWFNILAIVTTFEIYSSISIARFDYKDNLDEYVSSSLFLSTIITSIFYILVLIFHNFFENLFSMNFITLNLIFIYLLVYPSIQMYQIKNQINYNYLPTIIISIINAILSTIGAVFLVLIMKNKLMGRVYGYFIPLIVTSLFIYILLLKKGKKVRKKYWVYALKISFPLIWHLLAGYLLSSSDKIMITKLISPNATALYSVSYTVSMVVSILWTSMNNAWAPWAYEKMDKKDYESLKNNSKPYTILFIVIAFMFMLVTPELLLIMGGKYYLQAKYVMPPVMLGYIFQFVYSLYVNIEFYHKRQRDIAIGTIIAAIVNIILNFIFLPKFGYIAAAYTTLIGYILLFLIHFLFVKKLNCTSWYDTNFFIKMLLLSTIYSFLCNILYNFNTLRYILIIAIFIYIIFIILKNVEVIVKLLKEKDYKALAKIVFRKKVIS